MQHRLAYTSLLILFASTVVFGQSQIGGATINGSVTDPTSALVGGAKVTATQTETGFSRVTETSEAGLYSFSAVPVGTYDVTVEKAGFKQAKLAKVQLTVGGVTTVDVRLEVGATTESVDVSADVPIVETTTSQTATTVNNASISSLPVNGRNFLDFTLLTPGVVRDPSRQGDLSFGGQRGTANSLQIDGSDSNNAFFGQAAGRSGGGRNPYSFSQDAVQEFQVNANTYAAEIGRAGGGVINVITKSGTNEFHGAAFEFFRDKALNANSWENNRVGAPLRNYHYNQFGGVVGGPIRKNKAFFLFDYDGQRNSEPINVILGAAAPADADSQRGLATLRALATPYGRNLNNNVYLIKSDWEISPSQRLSVRYNANRFNGVNYEASGITSAAGHTGNSDVSTDNILGNHTWVMSSRALLESRFAFTRDNEPGAANSADPEVIVRQGGVNVLTFGRNNFSPRYTNAKTFQWVESVSMVRGRHSYKMGADLIWQKIDNFFPGLFSGVYSFNSYADFALGRVATYQQAFPGAGTDGPLTKPNVSEYAFYAQDSWRVSDRLTLNYGFRYDIFRYAQPAVKNPDTGLANLGLDTSRINLDSNNFAGRFGFAYKISDRGNFTIRGGVGSFYGRTPAIMIGTAMSQNGIQVQTYSLPSTNFPVYPAILSAPPALNRTPDIFVFAKDYVQPVTQQWSLNIERQLGKSYSVQIGYLGVRGEHLSRTRDINLQPAVATAGTLANGTPVTFMRHPGRVNPAFGRISLFDSGADSIYHSGFVQISKRLSQNFQVLGSYTLAHVIDSRPDFTSVVVGADDSKNANDTLNPNLERARGNADIRNRLVLSGLWDINYGANLNPVLKAIVRGYQLSLITSAQTGRLFNVLVGSGDPNNDGNLATDRPFDLGRNTFQGTAFAQVDLRFTRDIPLYKERASLKLMFEAFNLTNRANFMTYNTSQYTFNSTTRVFTPNTSNFLFPTATYDPRILQLGAKITF